MFLPPPLSLPPSLPLSLPLLPFLLLCLPPSPVGPGIDSTEVQFAAGVGGSVTLKCGVNLTGNPTPTIAWRDNTAAFINQSGGRYTFSSAGLQLTVYNVTVADDGNWTCVLTVTNPATAMPIGVSEELRQLTVICEFPRPSLPPSSH